MYVTGRSTTTNRQHTKDLTTSHVAPTHSLDSIYLVCRRLLFQFNLIHLQTIRCLDLNQSLPNNNCEMYSHSSRANLVAKLSSSCKCTVLSHIYSFITIIDFFVFSPPELIVQVQCGRIVERQPGLVPVGSATTLGELTCGLASFCRKFTLGGVMASMGELTHTFYFLCGVVQENVGLEVWRLHTFEGGFSEPVSVTRFVCGYLYGGKRTIAYYSIHHHRLLILTSLSYKGRERAEGVDRQRRLLA
jgi:hypothetical protein